VDVDEDAPDGSSDDDEDDDDEEEEVSEDSDEDGSEDSDDGKSTTGVGSGNFQDSVVRIEKRGRLKRKKNTARSSMFAWMLLCWLYFLLLGRLLPG
jgi:hypothetical protein